MPNVKNHYIMLKNKVFNSFLDDIARKFILSGCFEQSFGAVVYASRCILSANPSCPGSSHWHCLLGKHNAGSHCPEWRMVNVHLSFFFFFFADDLSAAKRTLRELTAKTIILKIKDSSHCQPQAFED